MTLIAIKKKEFEPIARIKKPRVQKRELSVQPLFKPTMEYLQALEVTQGDLRLEPFPVFDWEREFLKNILRPSVTNAGLTIGRGNGKTTFIGGLADACLSGPLKQKRADIVIVAASLNQARIAFDHILAFMGPKARNKKLYRLQDSVMKASITNLRTGSSIRCISSAPKSAHGLAPLWVIADEPAQWLRQTSDSMRAALRTAMGKIPNSKFIALGTLSSDSEHWFNKMFSGTAGGGTADYALSFANPKSDDIPLFDYQTQLNANPSMPYLPSLEKAILKESEDAQKDPSLLASYKGYRLNMGVSDIVRQQLLGAQTWKDCEIDIGKKEGKCVWGVDLGDGAAMSAISCLYIDSGTLFSMAAFPNDPNLEARALKDGVGDLYTRMLARDELLLTEGKVVRVKELLNLAMERFGQPSAIVADRFKKNDLEQSLNESKVETCELVYRGQGFYDGAADVRFFRKAMLNNRVKVVTSLLLRAGMANAVTVADPAGNEKLAKCSEGGRRTLARDDAVASSILAIALVERARVEKDEDQEEEPMSMLAGQ